MGFKKGSELKPHSIVNLVFRKKTVSKTMKEIVKRALSEAIIKSNSGALKEIDLELIMAKAIRELFTEVLTGLLTHDKIKIYYDMADENRLN